ncbi:MAG: family 20 glycosylhydrolase [Rikenellaceae bacterium]
MFKKLSTTVMLFFACIAVAVAQVNPKPFVIPELQQWKGSKGELLISNNTRIVVGSADAEQLSSIADALSSDIHAISGLTVSVSEGTPQKGDIYLTLGDIKIDNSEAYKIEISNYAKVTAPEAIGLIWASKTILQIMESEGDNALPKGTIIDYPAYPVRGFMLDVGRKYFTIDFLRDYVKFMAYYKMNTFHIHLSDNAFKQFYAHDWSKTEAAFRLESDTYPGLAAKSGHYTKQEFIDLQILAEENGILIIPEIDIPAHTLAFTQYMPEIGSEEYGMDHLDLFNPKTYEFFDALFKEYLEGDEPVFRGEYVHIGTDEYSNRNKEVVEKFRYFTDYYIRQVQSYGKKVGVWGALTHAKGETPVTVDNVMMDCWYNGYANPADMIEQGYDVVSIPDGMVYIVPAAGYYYDYLNCEYLYNKWTPAVIGSAHFEEGHPQIKGGKFAVWNDHAGNGITSKDVHHRVLPAMRTISTKTWKGKDTTIPYAEFAAKSNLLSEAPGLSISGRVKGKSGLVMHVDTLKKGDTTTLEEIGYNYSVEFTLNAKDNHNGAILFSSDHAKLYLRSPNSGKLAFERDGYLNDFNYTIPNGQNVKIKITGDNESTSLYVDGSHVETLGKIIQHYDQAGKQKKAYLQTLVFPLKEVGVFNGMITNLRVIQE